MVFGVLLLIGSGERTLTLVWLVGIFALVGGVALIVLAFRVRSLAKSAADSSALPDPDSVGVDDLPDGLFHREGR